MTDDYRSPVAWVFPVQTSDLFAKLPQDEGSDHETKARTEFSKDYRSIHRGRLISQKIYKLNILTGLLENVEQTVGSRC